MNIYCGLFLILSVTEICISIDISSKDDPCSKFDKCRAKPSERTCSCTADCQVYGTCCKNVHKLSISKIPFQCYYDKTIKPVFAKRACAENYLGDVSNILACLDDDVDDMDVGRNHLVTSQKTKITYWNRHCAFCNYEEDSDLLFWNIEVFCPQKEEVDRRLIRRNLTFNEDLKSFGLEIGGEFLKCTVKYGPPSYAEAAKHCTPHLISRCSNDFKNDDFAEKCAQHYGERILKKSDKYYKNVYCAICNGVDLKELECSGMTQPEDFAEEYDFKDMVEEIFSNGRWLEKEEGKRFECSKGFLYDPFWKKCRRFEFKSLPEIAISVASKSMLSLASLLIFVLFL